MSTSHDARRNLPAGTPDPYIEAYAAQQRIVAEMHLGWQLDLLRLHVGLVEIVPRDEDEDALLMQRTLRRSKPRLGPEPARPRFVPLFDGTGILVRDV